MYLCCGTCGENGKGDLHVCFGFFSSCVYVLSIVSGDGKCWGKGLWGWGGLGAEERERGSRRG